MMITRSDSTRSDAQIIATVARSAGLSPSIEHLTMGGKAVSRVEIGNHRIGVTAERLTVWHRWDDGGGYRLIDTQHRGIVVTVEQAQALVVQLPGRCGRI